MVTFELVKKMVWVCLLQISMNFIRRTTKYVLCGDSMGVIVYIIK